MVEEEEEMELLRMDQQANLWSWNEVDWICASVDWSPSPDWWSAERELEPGNWRWAVGFRLVTYSVFQSSEEHCSVLIC